MEIFSILFNVRSFLVSLSKNVQLFVEEKAPKAVAQCLTPLTMTQKWWKHEHECLAGNLDLPQSNLSASATGSDANNLVPVNLHM